VVGGWTGHDLASGLRWRLWAGAGHHRECPCAGCEHARQGLVRYDEWSQESPVGSRKDSGRYHELLADVIAVEEATDIVSLAAGVVRAGVAATSYLVLGGPRALGASIRRAHEPAWSPVHWHQRDTPRRRAG
jgi:hypothetical protein